MTGLPSLKSPLKLAPPPNAELSPQVGQTAVKSRTLTLSAEEFLRRFLIHVAPPQFRRIRHYGLLANRHPKQKVARCRQLLGQGVMDLLPDALQCNLLLASLLASLPRRPLARCPVCGQGEMIRIQTLAAYRWPERPPDTS